MTPTSKKWLAIVIVAASFFFFKYLFTGALGDPLSGSERDAFINSARKHCLDKQMTYEENKDLTVADLTTYCACFADGLANTFTLADIQSHISRRINEPEVKKRIDAAADVCMQQLKNR
jgi:hypothetical protein